DRHRPRRWGVGSEHVQDVGLQRVLDVEQPAYANAARDRLRVPAALREVDAGEGDRGQRAGRVAGVDAGLLDVLHDPAEVDLAGPVTERVDVHLDGVVEEPVGQD